MAESYPTTRLERDRWVMGLRTEPRSLLKTREPVAFHLEYEIDAQLVPRPTAVVFLANRECPWRCVMCDLWQNTLQNSVSPGDIPAQIQHALSNVPEQPSQLKIYNSGSFFDTGAVPLEDYQDIATTVSFAERVIVECHPALIGHRVVPFQEMLSGQLEVALGLETAHPEALQRLNKGINLDLFARACEFLKRHKIGIRVFLLVNPPFVYPTEREEWLCKSLQAAFDYGADVVSLILTRGNNGPMQELQAQGFFDAATLDELEAGMRLGLQMRRGRVFADTWDIEKFTACPICYIQARGRIERMNITQQILPALPCTHDAAV